MWNQNVWSRPVSYMTSADLPGAKVNRSPGGSGLSLVREGDRKWRPGPPLWRRKAEWGKTQSLSLLCRR